MALHFGRSDSGRSVDIGHEVATRMWVSLQLALPLFILQVIASIGFSLLLVFFRHSRIDFWGVVLCVADAVDLEPVLHHRRPVLVLAPAAAGADLGLRRRARRGAFPAAAGVSVAAGAAGQRGAAVPRDVPRGDRQGLRAHRARQGPERIARARPPRAAQRADPDHHQCRLLPAVRVPRQPGVRELLRHSRARRVRDRGDRRPGLRDRAHDGVPRARCSTSRATC